MTGPFPNPLPSPQTPLVDAKGCATKDGRYLWLALWNRTGAGNGIIPVISGIPPSVNNALLVAAGTTQADGLQLTDDWNYFGTVPAGAACVMPPQVPGNTPLQVFNGGLNPLLIFPPVVAGGGFKIDALGLNAGFALAAGKLRIFECWSMTQLVSLGN